MTVIENMRKRYLIILTATVLLSVPAVYLKTTVFAQSNPVQSTEPPVSVQLAVIKEAEEKKAAEEAAAKAAAEAEAARIEAERVAAEQAAQAAAAEAEAQRVAAEKAALEAAQAAQAASCGPQDPAYIYRILTESGVPRESAIQQLGSWKTESGFDHCQKRGDSGIAWGLNSWHPGRRADMPETLREQVLWAVHTEMKRDCSQCYQVFMTPNVGRDAIRTAIQQSTRWGHEGARWTYANQFSQMF